MLAQRRLSRALDTNNVQPALVAKKLVNIEDDWRAQVELSIKCSAKTVKEDVKARCVKLSSLFNQACSAIAKSFVHLNGNNNTRFEDFMKDVCTNEALSDAWKRETCNGFAASVLQVIPIQQDQQYDDACQGMWSTMVDSVEHASASTSVSDQATDEQQDPAPADSTAPEEEAAAKTATQATALVNGEEEEDDDDKKAPQAAGEEEDDEDDDKAAATTAEPVAVPQKNVSMAAAPEAAAKEKKQKKRSLKAAASVVDDADTEAVVRQAEAEAQKEATSGDSDDTADAGEPKVAKAKHSKGSRAKAAAAESTKQAAKADDEDDEEEDA